VTIRAGHVGKGRADGHARASEIIERAAADVGRGEVADAEARIDLLMRGCNRLAILADSWRYAILAQELFK
jgi:hypothetical protein